MMVRLTALLAAGLMALAVQAGCQGQPGSAPADGTKAGGANTAALCGKCGFAKGTAECCKVEGKEKCAKCGLIKGSPGCCKPADGAKPGGANAALCGKCGFVKGSDECCKVEGKEKCTKCGLVKGSPGCCKIK